MTIRVETEIIIMAETITQTTEMAISRTRQMETAVPEIRTTVA